MAITDRYAGAVRSSDLSNKAMADQTISTDSDVLGAYGIAAKRNPLAVALARLFCGDNHASEEITETLAKMAWGKADAMHIYLHYTKAKDMARAVLAWHRDGGCRACGGHGFELIRGAPSIGDMHCQACHGTRKVPFGAEFAAPVRVVAMWLLAEVEREQSRAGPLAMARLVERMG